jgi:hypothetical protein
MSVMSRIARILTDRPLCLTCLSLAASMGEDGTQAALDALAASVLVIEAVARCGWCSTVKKTFTVPLRF